MKSAEGCDSCYTRLESNLGERDVFIFFFSFLFLTASDEGKALYVKRRERGGVSEGKSQRARL